MRGPCLVLLSLFVSACGAAREPDPFSADGEVIAFGGGEAGAKAACFTCHGIEGEGDGRLAPRLAALDAGYLQRQLGDFADGRRDHVPMRAIAKRLSDGSSAKVSAYYAQLPAPSSEPQAAIAGAGKALWEDGDPVRDIAPCASCHGAAGEGVGPGHPPLAGQAAPYIAAQLDAWRTGKRQNDALGEMRAISRRLSPRQIEAVSAYAETLSGAAPRVDRGASL